MDGPRLVVSLKYGPGRVSENEKFFTPMAYPTFRIMLSSDKTRPLSTSEEVKKGLAVMAQARLGDVVSYGPLFYKRHASWNEIEKQGTFLAWCQVLGEILYAKSKRPLSQEDISRFKKLRLFVLGELSLIYPDKEIKLEE